MRLQKQAMKQRISVLAAAIAMMAAPAVAEAQDQPWLRDRGYTEGIGFRVGDFELHPGLAAEFGYDSNYLHRAPDEGPIGSLRLRLTPSLSASTLGTQRRTAGGPPPDVEFRSGLAVTCNVFFPVSSVADADRIRNEDDCGGFADLDFKIFPSRPWSADIYANFTRDLTPSNQPARGEDYNRDVPRAGAELIWTPGSGLLDWRLGYQFTGTFFEASPSSSKDNLNNLEHQIHTRGRWRFFPRTALMYDARFSFINYIGADATKPASHPLRTRIGLNGLVTSSFSVLALVGWGASFYTPAPQEDFNSVIGQLELKWFITPNPSNDPAAAGLSLSTLSVGFIRDFSDSYLGTYFERDRGYFNFSHFFGGRFLVVAEGGAGPVRYPRNTFSDQPDGFTDIGIDASLFGEYRLRSWFGINATLRYNQNISGANSIVDGTDPLAWQQFEAYLGARWLM